MAKAAAGCGLRLAFAGGGTGGHIVPGLHLLAHLEARGERLSDLLWFHSGRAVEERVMAGLEKPGGADVGVPADAFERVVLSLEPPGGGAPGLMRIGARLGPSVLRARRSLRAHRTEVLLGLGGFTTVPAVLAAKSLGIPACLIEINATPGRATRHLARFCRAVLHAWPASVPEGASGTSGKHRLTGAPLAPGFRPRVDPAEGAAARSSLGFDPNRPLLVVFGGSQGAKGLNEFLRVHVAALVAGGAQVLHQVGPGRLSEAGPENADYRPVEYVEDVPLALRAADLVLCRGGASTLAEIGAVRVPALVVPYPHHADRHQERNALQLGGGVRIVQERDLGKETVRYLLALISHEGEMELEQMRTAMAETGRGNAAGLVLDLLAEVVN